MENLEKPQIITLCNKSLNYTVFDAKWIPCSAKFVTLGSLSTGRGVIQVYELGKGDISLVSDFGRKTAFKCGTFGASNFRERHLATGNFDGALQIWDLECTDKPIYNVDNAHKGIINAIDGIGGTDVDYGAPEIITGSKDGIVKVWDERQKDLPVAICKPKDGEATRDCWAIASGNSYNSEERVIAAGYDNGDIKMFDLRKLSVRWQTNVKNGVCSLEFDRKSIPMNKLVATTLESKIHVWDLRTQHATKGFSGLTEHTEQKSTIWNCRHLPQNREIFVTTGGAGCVNLWKYNYPEKRVRENTDGDKVGVIGSLTLLQSCLLSSQPISTFDWSPDKIGLGLCTSFDQNIYVLITTKLNLF